jgi:hypothetical protein
MLSSKNEVIVADTVHAASKDLGIKYIPDPEVDIAGQTRLPDFVIPDPHRGSIGYWEHLGMLTEQAYVKRWERKHHQGTARRKEQKQICST